MPVFGCLLRFCIICLDAEIRAIFFFTILYSKPGTFKKIYLFGLYAFIYRTAGDVTGKGGEREGTSCSKDWPGLAAAKDSAFL